MPVSADQAENYVLLLVLLSVFAGGTLVLLSLLLLFCHRCCIGGRRYSRASDDLEKTNTTYAEDSQPTQEITIHLDESDALSATSCHDGESERFVSTGSTGRRVSFNESALYEQDRATQDKSRRYTLTEGDFHHLKKARLTHLHLPPAPCDLKILTIMECDSTESSTLNISETSAPKLPLAIYQPAERRVPDWKGHNLSGGLPGDQHHSTILDQGPRQASTAVKKRSLTMEAVRDRGDAESKRAMRRESTPAPGQTSVMQFFSKLRRHASLEGAGPYFKRWKFDSGHRAASLDAKGSPKRRPFQRQRAASETTDHIEDESSPRDQLKESIPHTSIQTCVLQSLSAESLSQPADSVFLSRLQLEAMVEVGSGSSVAGGEELCSLGNDCRAEEQRQHPSNGIGAEEEMKFEDVARTEVTRVELKPGEEDDLFGEQQDAAMQERFEEMLKQAEGAKIEVQTSDVRKNTQTEVDDGDEVALEPEARGRADSGSSLSFLIRQENSEAPPSLYRDIWSLRASLEQYASSDQSSTDRESIRSDADSVSSFGGAGARSALDSCLSQDLDDEPEGEEDSEGGARGASGGDGEAGGGAGGGEAEAGNRKLLQMDSGYASIEAPSKAPEDMRIFATPGVPRGKTASERRLFFTSSGRKGSVCESVEARVFQEELEDEMAAGPGEKQERSAQSSQCSALQEAHHLLKGRHAPQKPPDPPQPLHPSPLMKTAAPAAGPPPPRLRRRDYSIDEKTDALFNEFLRHDPRFDQQESPLRCRHRSRVHLRKQWQRHKQYSDPGSSATGRYSPSLERQRFIPLRRGDSAGYPLDTRYHSTLSRIASAADEEAACEEVAQEAGESQDAASSRGAAGGAAAGEALTATEDESGRPGCRDSIGSGPESTNPPSPTTVTAPRTNMDPRVDNKNNNSSQAILSQAPLQDKLALSVEERLYSGLRSAELGQGAAEGVLAVSHAASPDFNPT